jgi:hypothetical protein
VHNKIGFAIFGFLYDFILILQVTGSKGKNLKNLLPLKPLELLNIHTNTLGSCTQALGENPFTFIPSRCGASLPTVR